MHGREVYIRSPSPPGFVSEQVAACELGCLPSELPELAAGVETRRVPSVGLVFSLSGLEQAASRPFRERRRFVRLENAAKRAGVDADDLATALLGRVEARSASGGS